MSKPGPKRKTPEKFYGLINRVKSSISKRNLAIVVYVYGVGFKVHGKENEKSNDLISEGRAVLVCNYNSSSTSADMVEDFLFEIEQAAEAV